MPNKIDDLLDSLVYGVQIGDRCFHETSRFDVKKIIRSGNRTIVFWNDGTKTIVKRADDEEDNLYHAFTAALAEKVYGSNSKVKKILRDKTVVQKTSKDEWKSALEKAMNILLCKKGSK